MWVCKNLGLQAYLPVWQAMQQFTQERTEKTPDEFWIVQHPPVFTQGQAGKAEHLLDAHDIPVIQTDRGGQVTYHGPGQIVIYCLVDLNRLKLNTREFVIKIEQAIINTLKNFGIESIGNREAPGVYIPNLNQTKKIASIGLRVKQGYSYHGLSLNVDNDLTPFSYINPCGVKNQEVTNLQQLGFKKSIEAVEKILTENLISEFYPQFTL
jgi:lipoyl(octanoyl) transferase